MTLRILTLMNRNQMVVAVVPEAEMFVGVTENGGLLLGARSINSVRLLFRGGVGGFIVLIC